MWPSRSAPPPHPHPPDRVTYLEVGQLGESLFTAGVGAFIRPVARVDSVRERLKHPKFRPGREEHQEQVKCVFFSVKDSQDSYLSPRWQDPSPRPGQGGSGTPSWDNGTLF